MRTHLANSSMFSRHLGLMDMECRSLFNETRERLGQVIEQEARDLCADTHVIVAEEGELTEATRFPETAEKLRERVNTGEEILEKAREIVNRLQRASLPS